MHTAGQVLQVEAQTTRYPQMHSHTTRFRGAAAGAMGGGRLWGCGGVKGRYGRVPIPASRFSKLAGSIRPPHLDYKRRDVVVHVVLAQRAPFTYPPPHVTILLQGHVG
jgi:hypothetical protein